jgi:hypothetical protein
MPIDNLGHSTENSLGTMFELLELVQLNLCRGSWLHILMVLWVSWAQFFRRKMNTNKQQFLGIASLAWSNFVRID